MLNLVIILLIAIYFVLHCFFIDLFSLILSLNICLFKNLASLFF
jgi:hypothetical protein